MIMINLQIRNIIFILALSLIGFACNDSSTGPGSDSDPAMAKGKVEDNGSQKTASLQKSDVEGIVVTAATVNADGSLQTISGAEAETNAEGRFSLNVDVEAIANSANRVVVMAERNGETVKAFVSQELRSGVETTIQPLTFESSAEANVFAEVVANGDADVVSKADIEAVVSSEIASELRSDAEAAGNLAAGLAARAEAEAEFYADQGVEFTENQKNEALNFKAEAMAELESKLDAATSEADKEAAFDVFAETVSKAEVQAGVDASAIAKSSELSSRVLVNNSTELSADAQSQIRKNVAVLLSYAVDTAVQAQMEAAGASESSVNAAADAAVTLRTNIKAMTDASKEKINTVFATFNGAVIDVLQNEFSAESDAFVEVNSTINESNGMKSTLESSLGASVDLTTMLEAYSEFYTSVKSLVDATFSTSNAAEAEAFGEIMILINIAS